MDRDKAFDRAQPMVADRQHPDRRRQGLTLVDHDLSRRPGERAERCDAPPGDRNAFCPVREQEVHYILHVLVVDQVAGLAAQVRSRRAVAKVDLYTRPWTAVSPA